MNIDFSQALAQIQNMLNNAIASIPNVIVATLVFIMFYIIAKNVRTLIHQLINRTSNKAGLAILLGRLTRWSIVLLGMLISLVIVFPDFSPSRLFELLGLGSIAIGFALRDVLQNFVSGLLLLISEPFRIGDQIIVDDFEGTVTNIEIRATTIKTYDGRQVVIPNTRLVTTPVTVNTSYRTRRVEYEVGIGYESDIATAKAAILNAITNLDDVIEVPAPEVIVTELGDFSIKLRVRWWIEPARRTEAITTRDQVLPMIKQALEAENVSMPYPIQEVRVHTESPT